MTTARRRGFALMEVLLAITVLIALSIAAVRFHSQTRSQVASDSLSSTVMVIGTRLRANYGTRPDLYASVSNAELLNGGQVSGISAGGRGTLQDSEGNLFNVFPVDQGGVTSGGFSIAVTRLPREVCTAVAVRASNSFVQTSINGVEVGNARLGDDVTAAEAAFQCNDGNNDLVFVGA